MPVNWQNGVTWVNAENLEIMEADTASKQAQSEKAQANGYAPLDGTAKVPLVHLPPVSGVDYIGTWGSGIAYKRGDVVRYGSNDYLAVNDSTGVTPPAAYNVPLGGVSIGTSLPASPYDGQEFVLTDSLTAPTYSWRFRYNAGSISPYKWEFVGGVEAVAQWNSGAAYPNPTGSDFFPVPAAGTKLTLPRAGEYVVTFWASVQDQLGGVGFEVYGSVFAGAVQVTHSYAGWERILGTQYEKATVSAVHRATFTAGVIEVQAQTNGAAVGRAGVFYAALTARPGRVA